VARLNFSPTRSNLLMIKQRLAFARQGFELLDKKRDVLIMEILRRIDDAEEIQREVEDQFTVAYRLLQQARAAVGTERVQRTALLRPQEIDVQITPRSIMGVAIPMVRCGQPTKQPTYGFGDTSVFLDQARIEWTKALSMMGRLSEAVATVWRLAFELRRTQRRANALESIYIPSYEETRDYIEATVEEKEREDLFRMKRAKAGLIRRRQMPSSTEGQPARADVS